MEKLMNLSMAAFFIFLTFTTFAYGADPAPAKTGKEKYRKSKLTYDESEALADRRTVRLSTGEDKAIDLDFEVNGGGNGFSVSNPQIVATTLVKIGEKRQLVFKPLKSGETNILVRDQDGTIRLIFRVIVDNTNLLERKAEIRELLKDVEGIDIRIVGQKIIIDGDVLIPQDYGRLVQVTTDKAYSDLIMNLAGLSPLALQVLAKKILEDVNTFAPNVTTRVVNGMIFLNGTVDTKDAAWAVAETAKLYLPEARPGNPMVRDPNAQVITGRSLVVNMIKVNPPAAKKQEKLVRVTVHFVELVKDYSKVFGFKWEPGFTADPQIAIGGTGEGGTGATGASFSATISSLLPKLASAQSAGYARVLKTGTVITRSSQPASLKETTEFPFVILDAKGQPTASKSNVGLTVAVTPMILGQSEDIQMDLELNQVSLTGRAPANNTPPIVSNHEVKTKIYVKGGESAAIAGVNSSDVGTDFNKDDPKPGAFAPGTDPLFSLKRSKAYRKKNSQFVIFVTPQILENASDGTDDLKKNFRVKVK